MDQEIKARTAWVWEFSKRLVISLSFGYFAVVIFAAATMAVSGEFDALEELIECNADVFKICVFGYFVKAGVENALKIRLGGVDELPEADDTEGDALDE